jgi:hypothetical protein
MNYDSLSDRELQELCVVTSFTGFVGEMKELGIDYRFVARTILLVMKDIKDNE